VILRGVKLTTKRRRARRGASGLPKRAGNQLDLSCWGRRRSRRIFSRCLSGDQDLLISDLRRLGPLREEGELEVADDPINRGIIG
jgi:hypothetical protein